MKLKAKQAKKLLRNQRKAQIMLERSEQVGDDNHLHLNFASFEEIKKEGQRSALNKIRRKNVKTELNQYQHNNSKHIRMKPFYDSHVPVHWTGIISDITTPKKYGQPEGSILIDKIVTEDRQELLDYHIWLNVVSIKLLANTNNQKVSLGDYIEGISYIKPYESGNISKYGLGETIILNCGIFTGKIKAENFVSNYDRGDDWVLDLENTTAGQIARERYELGEFSNEDFEEMPGHVSCTYQPGRYHKFQERLVNDEKIANEPALPLVSKALQTYTGIVQSVFAKRVIKDNEYSYIPVLNLIDVVNEHGRIIAKTTGIEYPAQLAQKGLIPGGSKVTFKATSDSDTDQLLDVKGISVDEDIQDKMKLIPQTADALAGYLLYIDNRSGDMKTPEGQKCLDDFFMWADENNILPTSLRDTDKEWESNAVYSSSELARYLKFPVGWIDNLVMQKMLIPIDDGVDYANMKFAGSEIDKLHEIQEANSDFLAKKVNERYHFYRAKDIAEIVGISVYHVANMIVRTGYKSFNKYYGENVLEIIKREAEERQSRQMQEDRKAYLLNRYASNKSGVMVKKEIPRDKTMKIKEEADSINTENVPAVSSSEIVTTPQVEETKNVEVTEVVSASKTTEENSQEKQKQTNLQVILLTQSGNYYTDQFDSEEEVEKFLMSPLLPGELNRFVKAQNDENIRMISVRNILEWYIK